MLPGQSRQSRQSSVTPEGYSAKLMPAEVLKVSVRSKRELCLQVSANPEMMMEGDISSNSENASLVSCCTAITLRDRGNSFSQHAPLWCTCAVFLGVMAAVLLSNRSV